MEYLDFESLIDDLKNVNSERKYWMVRTMGGAYYGEYIRNNFVAFGYNEITLSNLEQLPENEAQAKDLLKLIFADAYPNSRKAGYVVSQLMRFTREIHPGDVVIIPSSGASHVAIGVVSGDVYEVDEMLNALEEGCGFRKRIPIEWKNTGRRNLLPPSLQLMFNSRHILSDVTSYAPLIDSIIHDFYSKDETYNLVLRIKTREEVSLDDFCDLKAISILIEDFSKQYDLDSGEDPLKMKIQMESPGWLRLNTKSVNKILFFGLFLLLLTGGGIDYEEKKGLRIYTKGIGGAISDYLDRKADRELIRAATRAIDTLKIKRPEDLQPILEILKTKNEGRHKY